MMDQPARSGIGLWLLRLLELLMVAMGGFLLVNGFQLVRLGGSAYYLLAGAGLLACAVLLWQRRRLGAELYLLLLVTSAAWAWWESGNRFWYLFPRLFALLALGFLVWLTVPLLHSSGSRRMLGSRGFRFATLGVLAIAMIALFAGLFVPHGQLGAPPKASDVPALAATPSAWTQYAADARRNGYVPHAQIDTSNVGRLKVAWTFNTGDIAAKGGEDQNTPLQVGDTVYVCTPFDRVFALDADTGKQKWRFDAQATSPLWQRCRTLAYADLDRNTFTPRPAVATGAKDVAPAGTSCRKRLYLGAIDARLLAIDAETGVLCPEFGGGDGQVDLRDGVGNFPAGEYVQTSGPTVIENGMVVVGARIRDNLYVGMASGVVRAYDAVDGSLLWAWDLGNPEITREPPPGQSYTRGTPNVWAFPAVDEALGLIYLPTGNSTPDYWGGHRSAASDAYSSAVVALDYRSGRERWKFQTVHHDIWDYDLPAHPVLHDVADGKGGTVPALIQITKQGEIFVLDRRDGTPVAEVQERPVPTHGVAEGDYVSPTQPYSVGMPQIREPALRERDMWGMTLFDQLLCRKEFLSLRYDGDYTPQSVRGIIQYPGNLGGMNWGGASIDHVHDLLIVNDSRIAMAPKLVPRSEEGRYTGSDGEVGYSPQKGAPFGVTTTYLMSPLGVPCLTPPLGTLTAVDLKTRKIAWQVPLGTVRDIGKPGKKITLPMQVGLPSLGAALPTGGGLVFYSGTLDYYLRAFESASGREVWKARLPVGGQSTPMSYVSPSSGRQYVVVTASGSRGAPERGDYVIAYTLDGASGNSAVAQ